MPMSSLEELRTQARAAYERGDLEGALGFYQQLAEALPDDAQVLNDLGTVCFALGRMDESRLYYVKALSVDEGCEEARSNLAMLCRAQGLSLADVLAGVSGPARQPETSCAEQPQVLAEQSALQEGDPGARVEELFAQGDLRGAYELARQWARGEESNAQAWNDLAVIADAMGKGAEAVGYIQRAAELSPEDAAIGENLSVLLGRAAASTLNATVDRPSWPSARPRASDPDALRVLCLEIKGLGRFLGDLVRSMAGADGLEIRHLELKSWLQHIPFEWADVVWLEWANELAVQMTHKIDLLQNTRVVCRLHRYEAFTDLPAQINWDVVDRLILVSEHMKDVFGRRFPTVPTPRQVICNGIDLERHRVAPGKEAARDIAFVGHLNFRKNLPMLLQIARGLKEMGSDRRICVAGDWQQPDLEDYFGHMCAEMDLGEHLVCEGWVSDMDAWLADKRYVLSTSVSESFGYAVFEAMASGLRPVVHHYPGAREFLPDQFLFNSVPEALEMLHEDGAAPESYRQFVNERYPRSRQVEQVGRLLRELAQEKADERRRA